MSSGPSDRDELLGHELSNAVVAFHQAIAERLGLSATEWKCLDALTRAESLTAGRLAEMTGLTTGAITGIVDRLEREGRVRREHDPGDRRRVIIRALPDPERERQVAAIFESLGQAMSGMAGRYTEQELAAIRDWVSTTIAVLHQETAKLRAAPPGPSRDPAS
jgi:DNA-binding MarR family transcriptional regulator